MSRPGYYNLLILSVLLLTGVFCSSVFANAWDQNIIGVRGQSMGSAFTGISNDSSAIYYNPGGLTAIEDGVWDAEASALIILSGFKYVDPTDKEHESTETALIPGIFAATSSGNLSYGIGIYAPYGGGSVVYDDFFAPGYNFEATAALLAITPSIAYQIMPNLSAGIGLSVYYGIVNLLVFSPMGGGMEVDNEFSGIAGFGGNIGIMFNATEELDIGISVKSQVPVSLEGTITVGSTETDAEIEFTLPYYLTFGLGYQLTPELLIGFDFWYMLWSGMDEQVITSDGSETKMKTHYKDSFNAMLGAEYTLSPEMKVRGGIKLEKAIVEDEGVSVFSNCESDRLFFIVGAGYGITKAIELSLMLGYVHGLEKEIDTSVGGDSIPGTYSQGHKLITLGVRGKF